VSDKDHLVVPVFATTKEQLLQLANGAAYKYYGHSSFTERHRDVVARMSAAGDCIGFDGTFTYEG
jgi:hypothetical protein